MKGRALTTKEVCITNKIEDPHRLNLVRQNRPTEKNLSQVFLDGKNRISFDLVFTHDSFRSMKDQRWWKSPSDLTTSSLFLVVSVQDFFPLCLRRNLNCFNL